MEEEGEREREKEKYVKRRKERESERTERRNLRSLCKEKWPNHLIGRRGGGGQCPGGEETEDKVRVSLDSRISFRPRQSTAKFKVF